MWRSRRLSRCLAVVVLALGLLGGHIAAASAAGESPVTAAASSPGPSAAPVAAQAPEGCAGNFLVHVRCGAAKVLEGAKNAVGTAAGAVASAPGAAVGAATSGIAGAAADAAEASFTRWVADGAAWVLTQIAGFISSVTSPDVTAQWFASHYQTMWQIAVLFLVPFLLAAVVQGVLRQDPGLIVGAVARVPFTVILTAAAVTVTALALQATDDLTAVVTGTIGQDTASFLTNVGGLVTGAVVVAPATSVPAASVFIALGSILTVLGGVVVYLELLLRTVVVYVALLFLPLGLAAIVWPRARQWAVRLTEALAAAVVSKFLIAAVLSLAVAGMSGQKGTTFPSVILGAVLLGMAAFAPYAFLKMLPFLEVSALQAIRGRGGASAVRETYYNARGVWDRIARDQASRVADFHRQSRGAGAAGQPSMAGAGAAAGAAGVAGTGLSVAATRTRRSAAGFRDALAGGPGGGARPRPHAVPPQLPPSAPPPPVRGTGGGTGGGTPRGGRGRG